MKHLHVIPIPVKGVTEDVGSELRVNVHSKKYLRNEESFPEDLDTFPTAQMVAHDCLNCSSRGSCVLS